MTPVLQTLVAVAIRILALLTLITSQQMAPALRSFMPLESLVAQGAQA